MHQTAPLLLVAGLLAACVSSPAPIATAPATNGNALSWKQFADAGRVKGDTSALTSLLSNTSFSIRMIRGREDRYFAPDGVAYFRDSRDGKVETGWWTTRPAAPMFGHSICAGRGSRPAEIAGAASVEFCVYSSEWVGRADNIQRGDVNNLRDEK